MVEFIHDIFDFKFCDAGQIIPFWKVLPDQTIGILVRSTLPGSVSIREIDT